MTDFHVVALITCAALALGWICSAWTAGKRLDQRDQAREGRARAIAERDQARRERDEALWDCHNAVKQLGDLLDAGADTQPLPAWSEFLKPPAAHQQAAHDKFVTELMEQQFEEGR